MVLTNMEINNSYALCTTLNVGLGNDARVAHGKEHVKGFKCA